MPVPRDWARLAWERRWDAGAAGSALTGKNPCATALGAFGPGGERRPGIHPAKRAFGVRGANVVCAETRFFHSPAYPAGGAVHCLPAHLGDDPPCALS